MKIETVEYELYAHWACALINGDVTGMSDEDEAELDAWLTLHPDLYCVDCSEESEFGYPDCGGLPGDIATFTFHVRACKEPEVVAIDSTDSGAQWAICEEGRTITTGTLDDMLALAAVVVAQRAQ